MGFWARVFNQSCDTCEVLKAQVTQEREEKLALMESSRVEKERIEDKNCPTCEVLKTTLNNEQTERVDLQNKDCPSCESLKTQLDIEQSRYRKIVDHVINPPVSETPAPTELPQPLTPRTVPWNIRRHQLELKDKEQAAAMRLAAERAKELKPTEDLEKELKVEAPNG